MQTKSRPRSARISVAVLALVLVGWGPLAAQEATEFKAGISDPVNTVLAWYVARDAGFYAAHGLKVDIINMNGGSRGAAELQAGRLDVMHVGLSSVIRVNRGGGDIRSIGSLEQRHPLHLLLRARREDGGRAQGRRHWREHVRLGKRFHRRRWRWRASG